MCLKQPQETINFCCSKFKVDLSFRSFIDFFRRFVLFWCCQHHYKQPFPASSFQGIPLARRGGSLPSIMDVSKQIPYDKNIIIIPLPSYALLKTLLLFTCRLFSRYYPSVPGHIMSFNLSQWVVHHHALNIGLRLPVHESNILYSINQEVVSKL